MMLYYYCLSFECTIIFFHVLKNLIAKFKEYMRQLIAVLCMLVLATGCHFRVQTVLLVL